MSRRSDRAELTGLLRRAWRWVRWGAGLTVTFVMGFLASVWHGLWANPHQLVLLAGVVARWFARTVDTGQRGVVFRAGRVHHVVEDGLAWLIPGIDHIEILHTRATTLHLPAQRITTADGLVYDARVTAVVRILDPATALVAVSDHQQGTATMAALTTWELLRDRTREQLVDRSVLDETLRTRLAERLAPWGVSLDDAAITDLAPTQRTMRATQLSLLADERAGVFRHLVTQAPLHLALGLTGSTRKLEPRTFRTRRRRA